MSMSKCCKICKLSDENDAGAILFKAPQEAKKRKVWSNLCGVFLTKNCFVCQNHFNPADLIRRKNGIVPKANSLPTFDSKLINKSKLRDDDTTEGTAIPPIIKTEPPELVLVNHTESENQPEEVDAFLGLNLKVELNEAPEPLQLIHEARFDEENSNTAVSIPEKEKIQENVEEITKKRVCGQVEVFDQNGHEAFYLKCNYCNIEYQMCYWTYFIDHVKSAHKQIEATTKTAAEVAKPTTVVSDGEKDTKSVEDGSAEQVNILPKKAAKSTNDVNEADQEEDFGNDGRDSQSECSSNESDVESKNTDQDYEPKSKKLKQEKKVSKRQGTDSNRKTIRENLVFFDHPEEKCVVDYLELLKANPILWHRRQSIMKRFDEAIEKITTEFNTKWSKYQMTYEQSRSSINRIKDLYQRVTDTTHKRHIANSTHLKKYPKYFELCGEIEENSKKITNPCDNCRAFFFNEIDLQVHKYKVHRIGELPYKCSRCKYGFSKAEKLAEHEQKHHRTKTFTCEVCNKGFFDEAKLDAHKATHTNDYKPVCEICGEMFTKQSTYRRHRLHHEPPKEKCEICGKLYYEKWNLSEHVKSHRNERQYHCDVCGKSFNHQNDVTIHKRGVHNIKPQPRKYVWVNKNSLNYDDDNHDFIY